MSDKKEYNEEVVEKADRGLFDIFGTKAEEKKGEEAAISSEFEQKVQVSHPEPEENKESLPDKLHKSDSHSSSSSDEECDESGEKKKKKKPLKEKITKPEEKKGFIEKIKEKLPGGHKKEEEEHADEGEHKEKKGIFEKIKEKIPGYHSKSDEEKEKEKVKESD
ncbi:dehydrin ERD14 [Lactuca sativa]|uniref:Dehydrin n=1 Tax=Lactuca sativa TaxID=4236 RepID=A0A9R1UP42_LACSA|nr:dehydrin ERD14 [Lactuca sativa]KAJ0190813.1 hypothetical protein LSAT_V11C800400370 [Lactuca sativa]